VFNGETAFKLHDTFGFPLDLTADVCRERGVSVDSRRLRRRHGAAEGTGARRRQVQDGANARLQRPGDDLPRLRGARIQRQQVLALYRDGSPVE
jgi:alanyl-tRNA synthetase